jgi:glycerophosphoryl diester phosphodiesterase
LRAVSPLPVRHAFLDHPGPIAFAHRGGAGEFPENTMAAFEHAVRLGYRYLETDVHVTRDGVLLAFHDHVLDRVTDRHGTIATSSWAEIRAARIAGTHAIVRLDELLDAFPDQRFNIDPKHDAAVDPLADLIARANALDRVCVASFSDARLARVRNLLGPSLCTGAGPREIARLRLASAGMPLRSRGSAPAPCAQIPRRVRRVPLAERRFVAHAGRAGTAVHVWTVDDPDEMRALLDLGVTGIMTDRPAVLRDVLLARGEWHAV